MSHCFHCAVVQCCGTMLIVLTTRFPSYDYFARQNRPHWNGIVPGDKTGIVSYPAITYKVCLCEYV